MSALSILDSRNVLVCQLLLAAVFAVVFLCMKWAYPQLRGLGSIAVGFLFSAPGVLLIALRGSISNLASIVLANTLILCAQLYFYFGILRFLGPQRKPSPAAMWSAVLSVAVAVSLLTWFTIAEPALLPRLFIIALSTGYICALIAVELHRKSSGRLAYRLFSAFMVFYAALGINRAVFAAFGIPPLLLRHGNLQTLAAFLNVGFICALGIFFQLMIAGELTQAIEHRARHDLLTGTLNRHGIELAALATLSPPSSSTSTASSPSTTPTATPPATRPSAPSPNASPAASAPTTSSAASAVTSSSSSSPKPTPTTPSKSPSAFDLSSTTPPNPPPSLITQPSP